jgi:hypothetical protein
MADTTAFGKDKGLTSKSMDMISGGSGGGNSGSGPTGSSRSYPKGGSKPADTQDAPFNPQKVSATDYRVGGV